MLRGTIHRLGHDSDVLRGNPLGDPSARNVPVYLPPGGAQAGMPLIGVLAGYTGRGETSLGGTPWDPSFPERYERLLERGDVAPAAFVFPDGFTRLGGSQYMNSSATGRYRDYLVQEVFPLVEGEFGVGGSRERRGLMGKSSGGYGALHLSFEHPDVFGALASHAGDAAFDLCYRHDFPLLAGQIEQHGSVEAFVAAFDAAQVKTTPLILSLAALAMAACYSPDSSEPMGIALPFDPRTGAIRDEVWARWLEQDPVQVGRRLGSELRDFALVYVDAGLRDEYHLQYGARQLVDVLREQGVNVHHEEFDGTHRGINYRYDASLPLITRALAG